MPQVVGFPGGGIQLAAGIYILTGVGDPNTSTTPDVQSAGVGSIFLRKDGGAGSALYVREPSGWAAK